MDFDPDHSPRSLKQRLRSSICFSCCFRAGAEGEEDERPASLIRSSTVWLRSKAQELPEISGKLASRMGRHGYHHHHRRHSGGDFRYDPLSYALNFDEGADAYDEDVAPADGDAPEFRYRSFSSRLPVTPPHPAPQPSRASPMGIAC